MLRLPAFLVCLFCLTSTAFTHDQWSNGDPVPKWVKQYCCGPEDVHRLNPEDVSQNENGDYLIKGYPLVIPHDRALPSHDGYYWAFYRDYSKNPLKNDSIHEPLNQGFSGVFCFFVPMSG